MTWLPLTDLHASLELASAALPLAAGLPESLAGGGSLWALLGAVLLTSLLGSIHCVGMCGPLVVSAATPLGASRAGVLGAQLLYHAGRLATLGLLGALAGALGAGVSDLGQLLGFQRAAAILTGVALLGWGGFLLWRGGGAGFHLALPGAAAVGRAFQAVVGSWPPARRALLLGALTPLLPCGWLYLFVIPAAGSGSASSWGPGPPGLRPRERARPAWSRAGLSRDLRSLSRAAPEDHGGAPDLDRSAPPRAARKPRASDRGRGEGAPDGRGAGASPLLRRRVGPNLQRRVRRTSAPTLRGATSEPGAAPDRGASQRVAWGVLRELRSLRPRGPAEPQRAGSEFCCQGCEAVAAFLGTAGQAADAARRAESTPSVPSGRGYQELDDPAFHERHVARDEASPSGSGARVTLYLEGTHCAACVWLVERLPRLCPGVQSARLDLSRGLAHVQWDPDQVALSAIAQTLDRLGYRVHPYRIGEEASRRRAEDRAALVRLAVAGALAGNVMLISFATYGGIWHGMEPALMALFRWVAFALSLVSVFGPGRTFLRGALSSLESRVPHVDLPVSLALLAGVGGGLVNTLRGVGEVYFDTVDGPGVPAPDWTLAPRPPAAARR